MNNTTELKIGKKTYKITFGMMANELFLGYQSDGKIPGPHKLTIDLIYAGIENECYLERSPSPKYRDIAEAIEQIYDEKSVEGLKQIEDIFTVYNTSRAKRNLDDIQQNIKKKLDELQQESQSTTTS